MLHVLMIETGMENIPIGVFGEQESADRVAMGLTIEQIEQLTDDYFKAVNRPRGIQDVIQLTTMRVEAGWVGFPGVLNECHRLVRDIMFKGDEGTWQPETESV